MIIWFTGQPGSGKTTLANSTIRALTQNNADLKIINLDGGEVVKNSGEFNFLTNIPFYR